MEPKTEWLWETDLNVTRKLRKIKKAFPPSCKYRLLLYIIYNILSVRDTTTKNRFIPLIFEA